MKDLKDLKVALVHDWLIGGGAERVVHELHHMFPEAPIYTSYATDEWRKKLDDKVVTGFLQHWPFSAVRKFIPFLRMWWFLHLDLSSYDVVISSTGNGEAKFVKTPQHTKHICYCNTPVHFYWRHYEQYMRRPGFGVLSPLARLGLRLLVSPLRKRDARAAQGPDRFIANSTHIRDDIKRYYGRDSAVIHPPVDTERFQSQEPGARSQARKGFVTVGRQVPHKHTEIIVQACTRLNLPLTVIGNGPEHEKLVKLAGPTVTFLKNVSDKAMPQHLARAKAFIFASYEDFGITPVEAMASGTPVIAYKGGGALDYVIPGKTGEFFDEQTSESLKKALQVFSSVKYSSGDIKQHVEQFDSAHFRKKLSKFLADTIQ